LLLVRLTELLNLKRLGTDLLLTTSAKGILVGSCAILFISAVGGPGDGDCTDSAFLKASDQSLQNSK
jgi:hypothetical protein